MSDYSLVLPQYFDGYAAEIESKGWFADARISGPEGQYPMTFYDPVRLAQDVEADLKHAAIFFEHNVVVVPSVTRENMERAVQYMVEAGRVKSLIGE